MMRVVIVALGCLAAAACSASRYHGPGRSIDSCDYCVVSEEETYGYFEEANRILGHSFNMLREDDPRLRIPAVRERSCRVTIDWSRGFWSTTAWVEVKDYESGQEILMSYIRRGGLYAGAHGDVIETLQDVAAARAAGPPLPVAAELPPPVDAEVDGRATSRRSTEARLSELKQLYEQGLISQREYEDRRRTILDQL